MRGPVAADCVQGWVTPHRDSARYEEPLRVIRRMTGVEGPLEVVDLRTFEGPESPPSDKGYLLDIRRWYVKAFAKHDLSFQGRFLVESREFGAGLVGVAPYDTAKLGQLRLGFYWSPLKIFEYMACALPTVTVPRFPLTEIVRDGQEGRHVREADAADLARVLVELADRPDERRRLGDNARRRVVESYSWAAHCRQLEAILTRMAS